MASRHTIKSRIARDIVDIFNTNEGVRVLAPRQVQRAPAPRLLSEGRAPRLRAFKTTGTVRFGPRFS